MFDRSKFLALIPTEDPNVDDAIRRTLDILDELQVQPVRNLQSKLEFQTSLLEMKLRNLPSRVQPGIRELLDAIVEIKRQHQLDTFITGRGFQSNQGAD